MDILYEKVSSRLALARKPNGAFLSNSVGLNSINVDGEDNEKLPKRGWTLVECGGLSPDELMRRHVFPFHRGNDTLEITDRPLKKIPFLRELNERRSVTNPEQSHAANLKNELNGSPSRHFFLKERISRL